MLLELTVRNLGVIEELNVVFGPGMTALTGETGAGKTLVVEAIELLVGGRTDPALVRPGADEAVVEGRFAAGDEELVLARIVPVGGRSRGYIDGHMATAAALSEAGARLVDLHAQHTHQSLLAATVQRAALDTYGEVYLAPLRTARDRLRQIDAGLAALGGDSRARAREVDLLRFQVAELEDAHLEAADEEAQLEREEAVLAEAATWREAAARALGALQGDDGATDMIGAAIAALRGRAAESPFAAMAARLDAVSTELADVLSDVRSAADGISEDPDRLTAVQDRRHTLRELRRKYGDTLADVIAYLADARARLDDLQSYGSRAAALEAERADAEEEVATAALEVLRARQAAAPGLAKAVEANLVELAMPHARFGVSVGEQPPGDEVLFTLGANVGEPLLPLAKAASGGELARTMLALRLVLTAGPPTLVFDEVDAGIGGEAAIAVGRALAGVGRQPDHQVLVVTHLAQVAAFADAQIAVAKDASSGRTIARAGAVDGPERIRELSRMLSGQPDSKAARAHAAELLELARRR